MNTVDQDIVTDKPFYYVSAIDGDKKYLIAGPYATHTVALSVLDTVKEKANEIDGRSWFMAWGTAGSEQEIKTPLGVYGVKV